MKGYGIGERYSADPIGSHEPRGKDTSRRLARNDPGWTPTESKLREQSLRQFMKNPEGSAHRDETAYKSASCWCSGCDGRRLAVAGGMCLGCASNSLKDYYAASTDQILSEMDRHAEIMERFTNSLTSPPISKPVGVDANGSPTE